MNNCSPPKLLVLALLATVATACNSPEPKQPAAPTGATGQVQADSLRMMQRHDSLMAQMDQLFTLREKLTATHSPTAAPYVRGLQAADAAMMTWMHQYHAPDSAAPAAQRQTYFREQLRQLAKVRRQFRTSTDSAAAFLKR